MDHPPQSKHSTRLFAERPGTQWQEVGLIAALCGMVYFLVCLITYTPTDPSWNYTGDSAEVVNLGGSFGAVFADLAYSFIGRTAYLAVFFIGVLGWRGPTRMSGRFRWLPQVLGFVLALLGASGIEYLYFPTNNPALPFPAGGVLGSWSAEWLSAVFGPIGATLLMLGMLISGITLATGLSWFACMDYLGWLAFKLADIMGKYAEQGYDRLQGIRTRRAMEMKVQSTRQVLKTKKPPQISPQIQPSSPSPPMRSPRQDELPDTASEEHTETQSQELPPLDLLDTAEIDTAGYSADDLASMSQQLILKLKDFNVDVQVAAVQPGPVITRFEIEPAPGVKASTIVGLARDLARALSVESVRVVENIPGKSVLGIELPNQHRQQVNLVDVLAAREYQEHASPITLVLGKDIAGAPVVSDLMKMPHVLIAGTTGSGKSVCINALILSILYKSTPDEVRLIMVDPKFLELSVYDGIPHLLCPVITDLSRAEHALRWCVREMDRRFQLLAETGVRNIVGFNKKVQEAAARGEPLYRNNPEDPDEPGEVLTPLPFIVVIIDELADLMMVTGKKVEELIIRIAQRARAAGMHLVLATQRPSVDVVTGLIKANVPTRIAFQVASRADSRTVLDQMGAEQLLGQGDMLFLPPGTSFNQRVHGAFVSDEEVFRVVAELKKHQAPDYSLDITAPPPSDFGGEGGDGDGGDGEQDPLYSQAVEFVTQSGRTSISALQRALRVGYNRAARMIDTMEQTGIIQNDDSGKRAVREPIE